MIQALLPLLLLATPVRAEKIKLVAVAVEKIEDLARKQLYEERKAGLDSTYGIRPGSSLGGAGAFAARILKPAEVDGDTLYKSVRESERARGEDVVFLRTNAKIQLFGSQAIPISVPGPSVGLRLAGMVEVVETRVLPKDRGGAWQHAKDRTILWPLDAEELKRNMRVGEDMTITGRLDRGTAIGVGFGKTLGVPKFGSVGAGVTVSEGRAADEWVTLRLKKTGPAELRVFLQRGDGESFGGAVSASAGLDLYDDEWIPRSSPEDVETSWVGVAVLKGESALLKRIEKLLKAELSVSWSHAKRDTKTEGWGTVHLDDPRQAHALDRMFSFDPGPLRALPPSATYSPELGAGRIESDTREVTDDVTLQARLSKLHATRSANTSFYELRTSVDGRAPSRALMGVARSRFRGDVTNTERNESAVLWYDLDTLQPNVSMSLGPEKRLMTTTRERINDVIAAQSALGLNVDGKIDHPSPYLQLGALGNYGRTEENGRFALGPEGVKRVGQAPREKLVAAYLRADWLYERQSFPPGKNFWGADAPPPWAATSDPQDYVQVYAFLTENAREVKELSQPGRQDDAASLAWLENEYRKLAPGRYLRSDADRFLSAQAFARHVDGMKGAGEDPEKVIELFLQFKKDRDLELKRAVTATASVAGSENYSAYLEMTGKRVQLRPGSGQFDLMPNPLERQQRELGRWR
jgi:hypothetical protein